MPRWLRPATYRARKLRRDATRAERALWALLRGRRLQGAKFRRQEPLGPYIVDFVCLEGRLVVEADGAHHYPPPERDRIRDGFLRVAGLRVLRFSNDEILNSPDSVVERIRRYLLGSRGGDRHWRMSD